MKRPTLKDVAADVGMSISCTARALKGRPGFPTETYLKVREAADRLGYSPDPMLAALSAYRLSKNPRSFQGTLAFIANGSKAAALGSREMGDLYQGAEERANSLGYRLEYFDLGTNRKAHDQMWRVIRARGIPGGLIRSFPRPIEEIYFPLSEFMGIDLFSSPHFKVLPTVSSYHAQSMEEVSGELLTRGYRHPGLILTQGLNSYLFYGWWMGFTANAPRFPHASTLLNADQLSPAEQDKWAREKGVDVLIYCISENIIPKKIPGGKKVDVVCMDLIHPECGVTGIHQNRFQAGAIAVEWLQSILITARMGMVRAPHAMMVPGVWHEGSTLRRKPLLQGV